MAERGRERQGPAGTLRHHMRHRRMFVKYKFLLMGQNAERQQGGVRLIDCVI